MFKSDFFQLGDYIREIISLNYPQFNSIYININLFPFSEITNNHSDILYKQSNISIISKEDRIVRSKNTENNNNLYFNKNIAGNPLKKEEKRELKIKKNEFQYIQLNNKVNNSKEDLLDNYNDELNKSIKDVDKAINNMHKNLNKFKNINFITNINLKYESNNRNSNIKDEYLNKKRKIIFKFNNNKNKKYIPDNDLKKIRSMILDCLIEFINNKIKEFKNNKIKAGICKLQFLPINKEDLYHSKVEDDKQFLNKEIKEILSWNISNKYTNFLKDANSELVKNLISSEYGEYFRALFKLTFLDCLNYINGTKNSILLDGFPKIEEIIVNKGIKNKQDIERYINYINNYEIGLSSKIGRYSKNSSKK